MLLEHEQRDVNEIVGSVSSHVYPKSIHSETFLKLFVHSRSKNLQRILAYLILDFMLCFQSLLKGHIQCTLNSQGCLLQEYTCMLGVPKAGTRMVSPLVWD